MDPTALQTLWFALIAVLWLGYFFLEGFDFGVGILLPVLGRDNVDRRVLINTIGPVWDGNEVWLLVAGGATFAAFPGWYATLFSGFYLPLFLVLAALIARNVAFEYRGKHDSPAWRRAWDTAIIVGSIVPALLWGVAWANIVRGVPIGPGGNYAGGFFDLLNPFALLGGAVSLTLFALHGATFLTLRTDGDMTERARRVATALAGPVVALTAAFLGWGLLGGGAAGHRVAATVAGALAVGAAGAASVLLRRARDPLAFAATGLTILATFCALFLSLYPRVLPSSLGRAFDLTVAGTASTPYTLKIMTVVAFIFTPVVLLYQGWTYYVFRGRVSRDRFESLASSPIDVLARVLQPKPSEPTAPPAHVFKGNVSGEVPRA